MRGVIAVAIVLQTIWSLRVFDLVFVLTRGGPADATALLNFLAYRVTFNFLDLGYGSAIANVIFALTFVLAASMSGCCGRASRKGDAMSFARLQHGGPVARRPCIAWASRSSSLWSAAPVVWLVLSSLLEQKALIAQPPDLSPAELHAGQFRHRHRRGGSARDAASSTRSIVALFSTAVALALGRARRLCAGAACRCRAPTPSPS